MAKRFTDTDKWKKPFIRGMKAPYKLLWLYILDECDHAGIWQVDLEVAEIKIGERLNEDTAIKFLEKNISIFDNGKKWFIPDFIEFQYGQLNPENRAHNSAIKILLKNNLIDEHYKPLISPLQGAKDKELDKGKELDEEKVKEKESEFKNPFSEQFLIQWERWKKYKQIQHSFKYKSIDTEQQAINTLVKLTGGVEQLALETINFTIGQAYQGFVLPKQSNNGKQFNKVGITDQEGLERAREAARGYRANTTGSQP